MNKHDQLTVITGKWKEHSVQRPLQKSQRGSGLACRGGGLQKASRSRILRAEHEIIGEMLGSYVHFLFHLPGKKAETVRQILQDVFEQAEWRQPSVVLLDDLDYLARAPTTPEQDSGPEALLQAHIAQSKPKD